MSTISNSSRQPRAEAPSAEMRDAFSHCYSGTLISVDPDILALDPAERLEFSRMRGMTMGSVSRFDARPDAELRETMFDHPAPLERERAAWEHADRNRVGSIPILTDLLKHDQDRSLRIGLLWLVQKHGGLRALPALSEFGHDEDIEIADWATMLLMESQYKTEEVSITRPTKRDPGNNFDQTLPLLIAGHARTLVPNIGWVQVTLSPLWFETILGRVMACTREETFDTDLIIEKRLEKYHPDHSNHYEIFPFKGFSHALGSGVTYHQYESSTRHTFYPSGKVEDNSIDPAEDMLVVLNRAAESIRVGDPIDMDRQVVHSVRGRYMGWAYVCLPRILANNMKIGPGEVQLSSMHHKTWGHLTNTYLYGSFKGKLSDLDGDGYLDVNTETCHGDVDGSLDYYGDGRKAGDPFGGSPEPLPVASSIET